MSNLREQNMPSEDLSDLGAPAKSTRRGPRGSGRGDPRRHTHDPPCAARPSAAPNRPSRRPSGPLPRPKTSPRRPVVTAADPADRARACGR